MGNNPVRLMKLIKKLKMKYNLNNTNNFKIIDVTFRDGGYKTNFHFDEGEIKKIITVLDESGIEFIEVGYKKGSIRPMPNIGKAGLCDKEYLTLCRNLMRKSKLVVMLHPKNVNQQDIQDLAYSGVDLLRICIAKDRYHQESFEFIHYAKKQGLQVSANITRLSQYGEKELSELIDKLSQYEVDMIYFADSNGSMFPSKVKSIYDKYVNQYSIPFGFHAHDNLGLAQANAIAAVKGGAKYIDASLAGIGKGIGNLKAELFVAYLHGTKMDKYDITKLLKGSNFVRRNISNKHSDISLQEIIMGVENLSLDDIEKLKKSEKRSFITL